MKISSTLTIPKTKLCELFDLPAWADEATIKAAMNCAPAPGVIRACSNRTPSAVSVSAASRPPRIAAQVEAVEHDRFMAQHFSTDRRRLQGDESVHHVQG